MSTPTFNNTLTDDSYELLLSQFKDKPVIKAVLKTWTDAVQDLESDIYRLMLGTLYTTAEGKNIDRYGNLLGLIRSDLLSDNEYRRQIVGELMKRSSDGTPDRIRQVLEATLSIQNMQYFEHCSSNQGGRGNMGAVMIYGDSPSTNNPLRLIGDEGIFLKQACPITTGSCAMGVALDRDSLFIPTEVLTVVEPLYVYTAETINNYNFDAGSVGWSDFGGGITYGTGELTATNSSGGIFWQDNGWETGKRYKISTELLNHTTGDIWVQFHAHPDWHLLPQDGTPIYVTPNLVAESKIYFRCGVSGSPANFDVDYVSVQDIDNIPEDSLSDLDYAVDVAQDYIAVRSNNVSRYGDNWQNGVAAERTFGVPRNFEIQETELVTQQLALELLPAIEPEALQIRADGIYFTEKGKSLEISTYYQGQAY